MFRWTPYFYWAGAMDIAIVFGVLVALILFGVPVAASMGIATLIAFAVHDSWSMAAVIAQRMYGGSTSFILLAIPFYILTGLLMNEGGMTKRLIAAARVFAGRFVGGMGHVNVLASMLFSGMSGSAVADASGLGLVELEMMEEAGYDRKFSAAITAASSTIGPIVPPSIPFVVYGSLTGVSVGRLFLAGFIPGISMGLSLMVAVSVVARLRGYPRDSASYRLTDYLVAIGDALAPLGTIVIIVGGIMLGIFTPTEAAVVASLYALLLGTVIYRDLTFKRIWVCIQETALYTIRVMFVMAVAAAYAYVLTLMQVPHRIAATFETISSVPWLFILSVNLLLLFLGCFMESLSVMILVVPILLPISLRLGIDPVHFGVVVTLNLMIGLLSPPMGLSLYSVAAISKLSVNEIVSELWPYLLALLLVLFLVSFIPQISMWIPTYFLG